MAIFNSRCTAKLLYVDKTLATTTAKEFCITFWNNNTHTEHDIIYVFTSYEQLVILKQHNISKDPKLLNAQLNF